MLFQTLTKDDGLPHQLATAITQDADGFLWVGTQGGLARWDGYRFHNYLPARDEPGALPDNVIWCLHVDGRGRLWIGTNSAGLARYDREHDRFIRVDLGTSAHGGARVGSIDDDAHGGLWLGTDSGLVHFEPDSGNTTRWHRANGLPDELVNAVRHGADGSLWVGTEHGLVRRMPRRSDFIPVDLPIPRGGAANIRSLFFASDGKLWVGTRTQGAFVVDPATLVATAITGSGESTATEASGVVIDILEVEPGVIWLSTFGQGIVIVDTRRGQTRRVRNEPAIPSSLPSDSVWALYKDRAGLVWAGSLRGLSRFDPGQQAIVTLLGKPGGNGVVRDSDVFSVMPKSDGRL
jgi:ligand-binding sensor domain-containing protein